MKNLHKWDYSKSNQLSNCKTRQQIAGEYGWRSLKTFKARLEQNQIILPGGTITPKWQKEIYEKLGYPLGVSKDAYAGV